MKVAIVHDWLVEPGGAENVLKCLLECYPEADLFSLVDYYPKEYRSKQLMSKTATTSFIQKLPFSKTKYRYYIPLMPFAIEQFDFSGYDVVISSSYAVAKGALTGPGQLHVSYCHSPMRYAWDLQFQYLRESGLSHGLKSLVTRYLLHKLRIWDYRSSASVDLFVANSEFIKSRILKVYRRDSIVINPPVNLDRFNCRAEKNDYYLAASRLVPYKKIDLIVAAFKSMKNKKLIVVGNGPERKKIEAAASGAENIQIMGYMNDSEFEETLAGAKALVFAAEEDFGILPLEAQASGTPVIAYGKGGALETIVDGKTGLFFPEQTVESICEAVLDFDNLTLDDASSIALHAQKFSERAFRNSITTLIQDQYEEFCY